MDVANKSNRYDWLDLAKGFGIIFVIIGHVLMPTVNILTIFIYSFHIPLFFIVAGYTYNGNKYRNKLQIYLQKRGRQLLIPYVILYGMILIIWAFFSQYFPNASSFEAMTVAFIYGNGPSLNQPYLWFLSALFFSFVIFVALEKIFWNRKWIVGFLIIALSTLGIYVNQIFAPELVPWHLDAVLFCTAFVFVGNFMKDLNIQGFFSNRKNAIVSIIILFPLLVILSQYNGWVDIAQGFYGHSAYILLITGSIGTILIFAISTLISSMSHGFVKYTKFLGMKSQIIYEVHPLFIYALMPISILFAIDSIFYAILSGVILFIGSLLFSSLIAMHIDKTKIGKLFLLGKK